MECVSCTRDLDHCHGTLIVHTIEFVECTELLCVDLDQTRHLAIVDCSAVDGGCDCELLCGDLDQTRHLAIVDCSAVDGGCDCVSVLVDEEIQHDNVA
jgi:hypothetical protein